MPLDQNFTLIDLRAAALASVLFSLFAFVPGYALGWFTNVLSFRQRLLTTRLLIAVVLSVSVFPALSYWVGMLSVWATWAVTAVSAVAVFILLARELRAGIPRLTGLQIRYLLVVAAWVIIAICSLVDLQIHDGLYFSSTVNDHAVRAPITAAISRTGVRPATPFFFPGHLVRLRYHYLWYILCSLVDQLGGKAISPRQALIAGAVWSGIALIAIIPLYLRFFVPNGSAAIHRRSLIGVGLLAVTGLDLIPTILLTNFGQGLRAEMEMWNEDMIASWLSTLLWAPHHVVAVIACLTGFLVLWCTEHRSYRQASVALAACAFASAAGCSIYVTLVFATFMAVWSAIMLVRRQHRECIVLLSSGLLAGILSLPYMLSLMSHGAGAAGNVRATLFTFSFRKFTMVETILGGSVPNGGWLIQLVYAAMLPLNYFLELGFLFAIGWLTLKKYRKSGKLEPHQLALTAMLITTVVLCTVVRSSVIANNDLGWRGFMFAQFVLILWSVDFWPEWPQLGFSLRIVLRVMLMLGVYGTIYQAIMLRVHPVLEDKLAISNQLGRRTMAMRRGYAKLESLLPEDATIQFNPNGECFNGFFGGLYANRQVAAFDKGCVVSFGGTSQDCTALISRVSPIFGTLATQRPIDLHPIDVLVFQDTDPVWSDRSSFIWHMKPLVANEYLRAVPAREVLLLSDHQK